MILLVVLFKGSAIDDSTVAMERTECFFVGTKTNMRFSQYRLIIKDLTYIYTVTCYIKLINMILIKIIQRVHYFMTEPAQRVHYFMTQPVIR